MENYEYDASGNLIYHKYEQDSPVGDEVDYETVEVLEYDSDGNVIAETRTSYSDEVCSYISKVVMAYDENNNLIQERYENDNGCDQIIDYTSVTVRTYTLFDNAIIAALEEAYDD